MANRGRPRRDLSFDTRAYKRANERLRKLESVHTGLRYYDERTGRLQTVQGQFDFANMSSAYRSVRRYAEKQGSKTKPQIYRVDEETGAIRFITKSEYMKLDDEGKKYYQDMLEQFLSNETSMKTGIEDMYYKAYESFKDKHPGYSDMTYDEYMDTWKAYHDQVQADEANHFDYSKLQVLINNGDFNKDNIALLSQAQADKTLHYMGNLSAQSTDGKGGRFRNTSIADTAPRRPNNRYL